MNPLDKSVLVDEIITSSAQSSRAQTCQVTNHVRIIENCFAKKRGYRFTRIVAVSDDGRAVFAQVFACAATDGEALDLRMMHDRYAGAKQHIIEGGDHVISDFEKYVEQVAAFCLG